MSGIDSPPSQDVQSRGVSQVHGHIRNICCAEEDQSKGSDRETNLSGTETRQGVSWPDCMREGVTKQEISELGLKGKQSFDWYKEY